MKKIFSFFAIMLLSILGFNYADAQVTVTNPGNVGPAPLSGTYGSLDAAITDLNTKTTISGAVTIAVDAANPQTAPAGGYSITALLTGASSTNTVTFEGNANTVTANGTLTAGALTDGIFKIIGSDFVTIRNFTMLENPANVVNTPSASNNMTEWGVAILYATTTNGAQNISIQNCTIDLNRTYTTTFGIYSNSTHSATAPTGSATATTAAGGNHNLTITGNTITDVNQGIVVVGPTAAADQNTGLVIGGSVPNANAITNYGTAAALSTFNLVSGTMNGVLVRNSNGFTISFNNITSSAGGVTTGTVRAIYNVSSSAAPTNTFTNTINNNTISVQGGAAGTTIAGIIVEATNSSATSTMAVNNNNFTTLNHTVAATTSVTAISNASVHLNISINSNTFTNLTSNTSGSFTFISNSVGTPATGTKVVNSNSIVTAFNKTGAGGTVSLYTDGASSLTTTPVQNMNNNFSNITLTGATGITGWFNNDGTGSTPPKTITGNTFSNWTGGTSSMTALQSNFGGTANISNNTISNITYAPTAAGTTLTGLSMGASISVGTVTCSFNTISGLTSNGVGGQTIGILGGSTSITTMSINNNTVSGITSASTLGPVVAGIFNQNTGATVNIFKNKVYDITCTPGAVIGINSTAAAVGNTINIYNNYVGRLYATTSGFFQAARGFLLQSTVAATFNLYYNTVYLDGTTPTQTYCVYIGGATVNVPNVNARNNIFVNNVTSNNGPTLPQTVFFRLGTTNATNLAATTNNNLLYAGTPGVDHLIYVDGAVNALTNPKQTLGDYQGFVGPRESSSKSELPPFLNTTIGSLATYLHIDGSISTQVESGASNIAGFTDDFDNNIRQGNGGYVGTGTAPDIGADEFEGTPGPPMTYTSSTTEQITGNAYRGVNNQAIIRVKVVTAGGSSSPLSLTSLTLNANGTTAITDINATTAKVYFTGASTTFSTGVLFGQTTPTIADFNVTGTQVLGLGDSYFWLAYDVIAGATPGNFIDGECNSIIVNSITRFPTVTAPAGNKIIVGPLAGDYLVGVALFNRAAGKNITFDKVVTKVMREVEETIQNDNNDSKTPEQVRMVNKEFEEISWIPMENGEVYTGPLYIKRSENPGLDASMAGGVFATISAAVSDLMLRGATDSVRFLLNDASYATETLPITISPWAGASSTNRLIIKPNTGVTTALNSSSSSGVFVINGADYVKIDGSNGSTANTVCPLSTASRDFTITNTSTSTSSAIIWLQSSGADGATNNKIQNCNLVGNSNTTTLFGVGSGGATISTSSLGTDNDNNSFVNNNISKTQYGIYSQGASIGNKNSGTVINQNLINTASPNNVQFCGVQVGFEDGVSISGNNISGLTTTADLTAIAVGFSATAISVSSTTGNEVTNATITKNVIGTVVSTSTTGFTAAGISIASASTGTNLIANNMIYGVTSPATSPDFTSSIFSGGGAATTRFYYNSVSMTGTRGTATYPTYALSINGSTPVLDIRNNILFNSQTSTGAGQSYAIGLGYTSTVGNYTNLTSDNNDLFTSGTSGAFSKVGNLAQGSGTNKTTLLDWQTETGRDGASKNVEPVFVSTTDLHLNSTNASNIANLNAMGTAVSVTDDIDCQVRGFSTSLIGPPDIGADEFDAFTTNHYVNDNSQVGDVFTDTVGNDANPGTSSDPFLTINYAISQSNPGDTIYVDAGTYTEQVEINKDLVIIGAGAALTKVVSPAILPLFFTSTRPTTINNYPVIYAHDAAKIVIKSLTVDGAGQGNANNRFVGIGYHRAGGYMEDLEVKAIREAVLGVHEALGIFAFANGLDTARTVYVIDNNVYDFEKSGVTISGSVLTAYVDSNTVTGQGPNAFISQIGVELGFEAKGSVTNNTIAGISHNPFIPTTDVASGILVIKASDTTTTSGNTIDDAQAGIAYYYAHGRINNNTVKFKVANMSTTPYWVGIVVENGTATVSQNTVNGGGKGVGIGAVAISGEVDEITTMNDINNFVDSTDAGFVIFTSDSGIANCTINENSITNSLVNAILKFGTDTDTTNATCNWYGTTNDSVIASKINGPITYIPYLTNGTDSLPGTPGFQPFPGSCNGYPLITGKLDLTICLEACSPNEDTISVCMRSTTSPYPVISCATGVIDSSGYVSLSFSNVSNGPGYYIVVKHRNSIETWSATGQTFTAGFMTYDFTTDTSKAFGGNMTFVGGAACIYTGDVDQDGVVDGDDAALIETAAENFTTGYVVTDLNCDEFVDGTDGAYVDNNAFNFVIVEKPTVFSNDTKKVNVEKVSEDIKSKVQNSFAKMRIMPLK